MTLPMARDLGKWGIRVVTVAPGVKLIYLCRYLTLQWFS